jgi:predicted enzyme related to lactoylglutathione lyase
MGRIVHFEISADDLKRAIEFYKLFGWEITESGMPGGEYWLANTGTGDPGMNGAIMPRSYNTQPVINTISVDDLDDMIKKVKKAGGKVVGKKNTIPGVGDFIYATDTEGNKFGMLQPYIPKEDEECN